MSSNILKAYRLLRGGPTVTHIPFVDDYLLIVKATMKDVGYLKIIVDAYCSISSQAINLEKSQLKITPFFFFK